MKTDSESFENILDALNNLYKKTDDILFEVETLATEIRETLKKESASALAEEALADDRKSQAEEKRKAAAEAAGELDIW